jgi:DNA-directed RNA polymerase subunit RPC12/RpoP
LPESPGMVPLYLARVADLRIGRLIALRCRRCGHSAEITVVTLRERLGRDAFVKQLGPQFRCTACGQKGAAVDARHALGYNG